MQIKLTSILVNDQDRALKFYTEVLGFVKKQDVPMGEFRWITVVSLEGAGDIELVLEPNAHPASKAFQAALFKDRIPCTAFFSKDLQAEYETLKAKGVVFTMPPTKMPFGMMSMFEDTCGNLIQLLEVPA